MKFYQKKELSQEKSPILFPLQRRHTVVEGDSDVSKLQASSRSNSTSRMEKAPNQSSDTQSKLDDACFSPDASVSFSNPSNVIITESELSSSWLYKNKKEQMNANETLSTYASTASLTTNENKKAARTSRPAVVSTNTTQKRPKKFSCWCYLLIALVVFITSVGILSVLGSVIYAKFFSTNVKNETTDIASGVTQMDDFYPMRKLELDNDNTTRHSILYGNSYSQKKKAGSTSNSIDPSTNISPNSLGSNGSTKGKEKSEISVIDESINILNKIPAATDPLKSKTENQINKSIQLDLNQIGVVHPLHNFEPNASEESPYSKLFELYKELHSKPNNSKSSDQRKTEDDSSSESQSTSTNSIIKSNKEPFVDHNDNHMLEVSHDIKNTTELKTNSSYLILPQEVLYDGQNPELKNEELQPENSKKLDNLVSKTNLDEESVEDIIGTLENERQQADQTPEEIALKNMFESRYGEMEDNDADNLVKFQPVIPYILHQEPDVENPAGYKFVFNDIERNDADNEQNLKNSDLNEGLDFDWNRPVLETKIAVPKPIEVVQRFNSKHHKLPIDFSDQDRQFSMAKALERLRLLDANNLLPVSRDKTKLATQSTTSEPLRQSKEEVVTEQSTYLKKLRERFFEKLTPN